jgi:hypothetical protein
MFYYGVGSIKSILHLILSRDSLNVPPFTIPTFIRPSVAHRNPTWYLTVESD